MSFIFLIYFFNILIGFFGGGRGEGGSHCVMASYYIGQTSRQKKESEEGGLYI